MSWKRFLHRDTWDRERARELESYLQMETDENIARGMTPDEARYAAQRKLGNPTYIREEIYRMNSVALLETVWQDLEVCSAHSAQQPWLYIFCGDCGGDRNRCHYYHLQRRGCRAAATSSLS
jgi:hypothetical protein